MKSIALIMLIVAIAVAVDVPACGDPLTPSLKFSYWNGTVDSPASTIASLCHNNGNLLITWVCIDAEIIAPYQKCNDPLYNADAV